MLRLASDADVHSGIIRGLRRRAPAIDLLRVQDSLPEGAPDDLVLAWATSENRVLITNDRNSMIGVAYWLMSSGEPAPGVMPQPTRSPLAWRSKTSCLSQSFYRKTR